MTTITFPQQFQGFFQRTQVQYHSLIAESRETLHNTAIPKLLSPYYRYMVKENPQPSFMLLPLMFLGVAEASGGIQPQHRTYLPYIMLMMELCAVMDDTADRTPMRSNRETFVEKFGEESATPFAATLVALAARETARTEPELIGLLYTLVADLGSYELWEMEHRYPALSEFPEWLENRYIQAKTATAYALNSALQLNGMPHFSDELLIPMSRVLQDVDDIVNIIEARESVGENRDLDLGIVTYPLIAACEAVPGLDEVISRFWQPYHAIAKQPRAQFLAELPGVIAAQQRESDYIYHCLNTYGIPAAIQHIEEDCAICIQNTPEGPLRDIIEEFVLTFAARIPQIRSRSA